MIMYCKCSVQPQTESFAVSPGNGSEVSGIKCGTSVIQKFEWVRRLINFKKSAHFELDPGFTKVGKGACLPPCCKNSPCDTVIRRKPITVVLKAKCSQCLIQNFSCSTAHFLLLLYLFHNAANVFSGWWVSASELCCCDLCRMWFDAVLLK